MQLSIHTALEDFSANAWNELAEAGISDTPFARFEYLQQWWNTRGGGEWESDHLVVLSGMQDGQLVGIAPFLIAQHEGREALLLLGSIEVSDYLDVIVRPRDAQQFIPAVLDALNESDRLRGLPLDLYNVPETSPALPVLRDEAKRRGWRYHENAYRPAPRVELGIDFDTYLSRIEKKQRHEIRRKLRRASEGPTPAQFELIQEDAQLAQASHDLLELMAHDAEKARFLTPEMRAHMAGVMQVAWEGRYLWLAFLNVGGQRAAAALNFDYRNRLWGYNSAVNRDFLELSPGWVLLARQIQWACEHGREEFDFMRGGETYKYRFGAVDRHVVRAILEPT